MHELNLQIYRNLSAQIARVAGQVAEIQIKLDEITASQMHQTDICNSSNLKNMYEFLEQKNIESFPFKTVEAFEIVDNELKIDKTFREDLVSITNIL